MERGVLGAHCASWINCVMAGLWMALCLYLWVKDGVSFLDGFKSGHTVDVVGADVLWESVCQFYCLVLDDL